MRPRWPWPHGVSAGKLPRNGRGDAAYFSMLQANQQQPVANGAPSWLTVQLTSSKQEDRLWEHLWTQTQPKQTSWMLEPEIFLCRLTPRCTSKEVHAHVYQCRGCSSPNMAALHPPQTHIVARTTYIYIYRRTYAQFAQALHMVVPVN